jgi:hypothetical protein
VPFSFNDCSGPSVHLRWQLFCFPSVLPLWFYWFMEKT